MSKKIRIGFLPLTKVNWTNEAMQKQRRDAIEMLSKIPNVEIVGGEDMIETEEQSLKILERFEKDRPDMLVALSRHSRSAQSCRFLQSASKCPSCCGR